jgi:cysteine desulfurase
MLANNETGVIQDLGAVADVIDGRCPLHTDAVQAAPSLDLSVTARRADLISVSAHKFGGPQGVGALVARRGVPLTPLLRGGGQERERRSGTHNVAGIVGMAAALETPRPDVSGFRDALICGLDAALRGVTVSSAAAPRLPNIANVRIPGVEAEALLVLLDEAGIAASAGASCASGAMEPSHVLAAMGVSREDARTAIRLSLGWTTTADDVTEAVAAITAAVDRLRR